MPHRGRDTVYVEGMIASCSGSAGVICTLVKPPFGESTVLSLFGELVPIWWFWCLFWASVSAVLWYGCWSRKNKWIEYGALANFAAWGYVSVHALPNFATYPLTAALAPIISIYGYMIFHYHTRIAPRGRSGREG